MGNIFANKKPATTTEVEDDYLGGAGALPTDIYPGVVKYAYISKARNSDARALNICVNFNGIEKTNTIWMTNRNGDVTYTDKKTKEVKNLPGFNQVNGLCMLLASKEVGDMDVEERTLSLYDFESRKEVNQAVDCFVDLHGVAVQVAVEAQKIDKNAKNEATGEYEPTGDTTVINEFIKFFPEDKLVTISEVSHFIKSLGGDFADVLNDGEIDKAISKMEDGEYAAKWLEKFRGKERDKTDKASSGGKSFGGGKSKSESGSSESKSKASLFDD